MKALIKSLLRKEGYAIAKYRPRDTFESVQLAIAYVTNKKGDCTLVQIGACDGISNDPVNKMVSSQQVSAHLIEPNDDVFDELSLVYAGRDVKLYNYAIGGEAGTRILYTVKNEGRWKNNTFSKGWSSFDIGHLVKLGVKRDEIVEKAVKTITLEDFVRENDILDIDVLVIDVEGYDYELVVSSVMLRNMPAFIYFEHVHIDSERLHHLCSLLKQKGYSWAFGTMNVLCVHEGALS